jgi:hypothetical protein
MLIKKKHTNHYKTHQSDKQHQPNPRRRGDHSSKLGSL